MTVIVRVLCCLRVACSLFQVSPPAVLRNVDSVLASASLCRTAAFTALSSLRPGCVAHWACVLACPCVCARLSLSLRCAGCVRLCMRAVLARCWYHAPVVSAAVSQFPLQVVLTSLLPLAARASAVFPSCVLLCSCLAARCSCSLEALRPVLSRLLPLRPWLRP